MKLIQKEPGTGNLCCQGAQQKVCYMESSQRATRFRSSTCTALQG